MLDLRLRYSREKWGKETDYGTGSQYEVGGNFFYKAMYSDSTLLCCVYCKTRRALNVT